jgi:hypothetical protein
MQWRLALADWSTARRKYEPLHPSFATGLKVVERAKHIADAVSARIGDGGGNAGIGRQVHNRIDPSNRPARQRLVNNLALNELDTIECRTGDGGNVRRSTNRIIIDNPDL